MADRGRDSRVAGCDRLSALDDVLVVTVRKSFWASDESRRWPRRIYARVLYGHSTNLVNSTLAFARSLVAVWLRPPRIVLLGSVERTVPWFIHARRIGALRGAKLVVTNQLHLSSDQLDQVERVIVYARAQAATLGEKGAFVPLPADGDLGAAKHESSPDTYVFSGGGAGRDFATLVQAVRGTSIPLEVIAFRPEDVPDPPDNVRVRGPMAQSRFLERLGGARVVVVPLESAESPHGQSLLVQALALGKPVVATRAVGTTDYVEDGENGLLVTARDVEALRAALLRLRDDEGLRNRLASAATATAPELSYERHADRLAEICRSALQV